MEVFSDIVLAVLAAACCVLAWIIGQQSKLLRSYYALQKGEQERFKVEILNILSTYLEYGEKKDRN